MLPSLSPSLLYMRRKRKREEEGEERGRGKERNKMCYFTQQ